ncbi:MAG: bifunctional ADP-dependent (S)-NAD(P)H-hydrate dehydratase/NAD(P)H-hydrate epimerase [Verrucomicrobiaceae bacterium]|nr:bifunctional ADP-dependent (S)-NAD(P)H-hydrate dehydratase/NAD(P)H-hydrate epimerase [Verrucomicrobiaceae bacterium]
MAASQSVEIVMNEPSLPISLYTAAQVRELDRIAIEEHGIPAIVLMKRAGRAAFELLLRRWPGAEHFHIFCGTGNNGGDGFVIATLLVERNLPVTIWLVGDVAKISGAALQANQFAEVAGVSTKVFTGEVPTAGVIVDALLGTGLSGDVREPFAAAIAAINAAALPVLAVDIPSGLCSDSGRVLGSAVCAAATISFIGLKQGLFTGDAGDHCGAIEFADLAVPAAVYQGVAATTRRIVLKQVNAQLPRRSRNAHKGLYGHVLVIGGDCGMAGAALMAAQAAGRVGAGLVSCATQPEHVAAFVARAPEIMAHGVRSGGELDRLLAAATVVVLGPGLGRSAWSEQLFERVWRHLQTSPIPAVFDADALNMLAEGQIIEAPFHPTWVLTPHPGEAARLLGVANAAIQRDRFDAARQLQQRYGGAVVLKGAGTLIATKSGATAEAEIGIANVGNPGMASGGMGDVLSGVIGGLLAQHFSIEAAAQIGVYIHGRAGDLAAAAAGERGLLATDLLPHLRELVNP